MLAGADDRMVRIPFRKKQNPSPPSMWERLGDIILQLQTIQHRLDAKARNMSMRGKEVFNQIVKAKMEKDEDRAATYANELSQLRKMVNSTIKSQASLEGVILRLEAVKDFGEVRKVIGPISAVLATVQREMGGVVPEVSNGLRGVQNLLEDLAVSVGTVSNEYLGHTTLDDEAEAILREATEVAAQRTKKEIPEVGGGFYS
jgi:division protein CdvB (Snf7/Vps24/ESCRT-III family)